PDDVNIYYGLNEYSPLETYGAHLVGEDAVYLNEDAIVGVFMDEPAAISFNVAPSTAAAGWEADNPKALEEGTATINDMIAGNTYYFTYTVGEAGPYVVNAYFDEGICDNSDFVISYSIDGTTYNFDDPTATDASTQITATEGQVIKINVIVDEGLFYKSSITVSVIDGTWLDATEVELTGEAEGNSLTVTAEAESGVIYHLATTKGSGVTVTGTAAFTVKIKNGEPVVATEDDGTFTAVIPAGEDIYFTIVSDTEQTVTLSQTFAEGSQGYPIAVSMEEDDNTITVKKGETVYFTLPAGNYIFSVVDRRIVFTNGDVEFTTGVVVTVKEGDVLSCTISNTDSMYIPATISIEEAVDVFTAEQAGTYTNADGSITITFDKFGVGSYNVEKGLDSINERIKIAAGENNTFTFTYSDTSSYFPKDVTVTFTFVDGKISITDSVVSSEAFTLEKVVSEGAYTGTDRDMDITITLNPDLTEGTFVVVDPDPFGGGTFTFNLTISDPVEDVYTATFEADNFGTIETFELQFVIGDAGLVIVSDTYFFFEYVILTQEA
ncbi:MAG: hypothetical protein K2N84_04565, partial [Clostridia bacterium]|nr:hypothetical protein [Clostridia bacterium]